MAADRTVLYLTKDLRRALIVGAGEPDKALSDSVAPWLRGDRCVLAVGGSIEVVFLDA